MRCLRLSALLVFCLGLIFAIQAHGQDVKKAEEEERKVKEAKEKDARDEAAKADAIKKKAAATAEKAAAVKQAIQKAPRGIAVKPPPGKEAPAEEKKPKESPPVEKKPEEPQLSPEEQTLKAAKIAANAPALLEFFRKRSTVAVNREQALIWARQLGDADAAKRDKAQSELIGLGTQALPALRQVANDLDDPEAGALARQVTQALDGSSGTAITAAACHMLATLKPPGAIEVLLGYLPYSEDESIAEEIANALNDLAVRDGKPDLALFKALEDPIPLRRSFAAAVLAKVGGGEIRPTVRKLLDDPKPSVRLKAALALTQFEDLDAVPVLINLLGELPQSQTRAAEEYLGQLAGEWAVVTPKGDDAIARRMRKEAWAAWWKSTEGPVLLEEFKRRTLPEADREKAEALIAKIVDSTAANQDRDKAMSDVVALGSGVAPLLRQAAGRTENKSRERVQKCLDLLERGGDTPLLPVAARLLALRRPPRAAEALLAYLPVADDEALVEEVRQALVSLAIQDGKIGPAIVNALDDKSPVRRSAAAEALCRTSDQEAHKLTEKLLKDADLGVRIRVARALVGARHKEGVAGLIALIADINKDQSEQVFEDLYRLAEDKAPTVAFAEDKDTRKKCQEAWAAWWKDNAAKVELNKFDASDRLLGFTLIVEGWDPRNRMGKVVELDSRGKVRWKLEGLQFPTDALVISPNKVIVAEQNAQRVTARDMKNAILWQKNINQPRSLEKLPNGHIFVCGPNQLLELDRDGKEVWSHNRPNGDIMGARRFRNGQFAILLNTGYYSRMDSTGKEIKTFSTVPIQWWGGGIDILNNDHVLIPLYNNGKVVEFDATGKQVWEVTVQWPTNITRLANGNTLVGSQQSAKTYEFDKSGKVVWEAKESFRATKVRKR